MGYVYFLQDSSTGHVKIGCTTTDDVEARLSALRTGNPRLQLARKIECPNAFELENLLHRSFATKRVCGEFFELGNADLDEAERIARFDAESLPIKQSVDALKHERDNGILIDPIESHRRLIQRLREVRIEFDRAKLEKDQLELQVKAMVGVFTGITGLVTWKAVEQQRLDRASLENERPEIYREYLKVCIMRRLQLLR